MGEARGKRRTRVLTYESSAGMCVQGAYLWRLGSYGGMSDARGRARILPMEVRILRVGWACYGWVQDSYKGIWCAGKGVGTIELETLSDESRCGRCVRWRSKASLKLTGSNDARQSVDVPKFPRC